MYDVRCKEAIISCQLSYPRAVCFATLITFRPSIHPFHLAVYHPKNNNQSPTEIKDLFYLDLCHFLNQTWNIYYLIIFLVDPWENNCQQIILNLYLFQMISQNKTRFFNHLWSAMDSHFLWGHFSQRGLRRNRGRFPPPTPCHFSLSSHLSHSLSTSSLIQQPTFPQSILLSQSVQVYLSTCLH